MAPNGEVEIKYCGHSTFLFTTPAGKSLIIDPWLEGNPSCPEACKKIDSLDTMLITHAHPDHLSDAVPLAKAHRPQIGCIYELAVWLQAQGVETATGMNKGGTLELNDVTATMVNAFHSSAVIEGDQVVYAGEAAGYVVQFENGFRVYFAGDTCVFGDMELIAEIYQPQLAFLPIGDLYTMGPREAAHACRLLGVRQVIPMHYGTFPALTGTPQKLRESIAGQVDVDIIEMAPGDVVSDAELKRR